MIDFIKNFIKNNKAASGIIGVVVVAVLGFLAFGYFGVQFLFIDSEVNEANPFGETVAAAQAQSGDDADAEAATPAIDSESSEAPEDSDQAGQESEPAPAAETPATGGVETLALGNFEDGAHPTNGEASVITDGNQRFLRFENFQSDNGPDLNVYLRADDGSFIDLGDLKGNIGDQNYELPADVDLSVYNTVDIWCVRFGVSFGEAALA